MGGGKTLSYLLAGMLALAAAQFAQAKMWKGEGSDTLWSTPENWENSTLPTAEDSLAFRQENSPNKIVTIDSAFSTSGTIHVGKGSSAENPYIFEATDPSCGLTIQDDVWLGYYEGGWLWIKSGIYEFGVSNGKGMQIGRNSNNFWLKVGDGMSTASLTAKMKDVNMYAGSVLVADKATLDIASKFKSFALYNSSAAYITNSTATFGAIRLRGASSMTVSDSTIKVLYDLNVADESGANCSLLGGSSTIELINSANVFNVGNAENSTGVVTKNGGDWSCYYLRLGTGTGSTGSFTHNGGTLEVKTELSIGSKGTGTFTMNGGTVTLNSGANQYIGNASGSSGTLNLNGGTFTARCLRRNNDGATATINFNGGTLKANFADTRGLVASGVTINVGEKGGTIDSGNNSISVAAALSGTGAMTYKGGNTITLSGAVNYTGGTTIELGTKVIASTEAAKAAVLENGLVVDGRSVLNATDYTVFEFSAGGLTDDVINNVSYVNCADGTAAKVVDGTTIVVTLAEATCVPKTPNKLKIFENMTLDDIVYGKFSARMCGGYLGDAFDVRDAAKGYNKKMYYENGNLTRIIVEFQVRDGSNTKCVVVEFTEEGGSVYAKGLGSKYSTNAIGYEFYERNGTWHGSDPSSNINNCYAETITANGYGVCDIRVAVEEATEWTLDQDRSWSDLRAGATLNGDSLVRIIVAGDSPTLTIDEDVNVAKIEFVNGLASGISTTSLAVSADVTVACGMVELGDNVCVRPIAFTPASVTLLGGGSRLLYDAGESVCATEVSGLGYIEVASGATLYVDGDVRAAYILNNGIVVKTGDGTVAWPFNNASKGVTIVRNGTLKVASCIGDGTSQTVRVASGATFDMNGVLRFCPAVTMEEGAYFVNTGTAIATIPNFGVACIYLSPTYAQDVSRRAAETLRLILEDKLPPFPHGEMAASRSRHRNRDAVPRLTIKQQGDIVASASHPP